MKRFLSAGFLAVVLATTAANAQVVVRIGPPPPVVVERPGPPPHVGYIWTAGYHRWDGHRYVWVPGGYVRPPRPGAEWVPHRWEERHGTWVFVRGRWR